MHPVMKIPDATAVVGHQKGTKEEWTVHFSTRKDLPFHKNSELEPKFQKCKGRVGFGMAL